MCVLKWSRPPSLSGMRTISILWGRAGGTLFLTIYILRCMFPHVLNMGPQGRLYTGPDIGRIQLHIPELVALLHTGNEMAHTIDAVEGFLFRSKLVDELASKKRELSVEEMVAFRYAVQDLGIFYRQNRVHFPRSSTKNR